MLNFHISARRWFDRKNGNTYHSVSVYSNGQRIARASCEYGYGDQYYETACKLIESLNTVPPRRLYANGSAEPLYYWAPRAGITYTIDCADVARKSDL